MLGVLRVQLHFCLPLLHQFLCCIAVVQEHHSVYKLLYRGMFLLLPLRNCLQPTQ